jgi:T5SS/PEP-CTERM-associated repeat protein
MPRDFDAPSSSDGERRSTHEDDMMPNSPRAEAVSSVRMTNSVSEGRRRAPVRSLALGTAFLVTTALTAPAFAVTQSTWTGGSADWFADANWSNSTQPANNTDVTINGGVGVLAPIISGSGATVGSVAIGDNGTSASLTIHGGGTLTTTSWYDYIGGSGMVYPGVANSVGAVTVDGAGSTWTSQQGLFVGHDNVGALSVTNGGAVGAQALYVGRVQGGDGTVTVDGIGSKLTVSSQSYVGYWGKGALTISNGGAGELVSLQLGTGQQGTITHAEGTLRIESGGTLTLRDTGGASFLGNEVDATGTAVVTGAGSTWTVSHQLEVGFKGTGTITVEDGGAMTTTADTYLGSQATGRGTLSVDGAGSTWTSTRQLGIGLAGQGTTNVIHGGVLNGQNIIVGWNANASGHLNVDGAGSTVTSSTYVTVGYLGQGTAAISNGGRLNTTDGARLFIASDAGSTGEVIIGGETVATAAGTIQASGGVAFGAGTGSLVFNHTDANYAFDNAVTGAGQIVAKAGTTWLNGDMTRFTGDATIKSLAALGLAGAFGGDIEMQGGTLSANGTVAGTVHLTADGNTLNVVNATRFANPIQFDRTLSNTVNFYTGSYTLPVQAYAIDPSNTLNALGSAKTVITAGLDSHGTGNILVVDTATVAAVDRTAGDTQRQVSGVIQDIMNLDVQRPGPVATPMGYAAEDGRTNPANLAVKQDRDQAIAIDAAGNLAWMRGFVGIRHQDASSDGAPSSFGRQYGTLAGADHLFDDWRLGAYAGAGHSTSDLAGNLGGMEADMALVGAYARRSFGALSLDMALTAGHVWADTTRSINNGAETASGSFGGWFAAPEVALSTTYGLGGGWSLTPSLRGRYIVTAYEGYTETGSSQNVDYAAHTAQSFEERFDTRVTYKTVNAGGLPASVWAGLGAIATQRVGATSYDASVSGTDFSVTASGPSTVYAAAFTSGFDVTLGRSVTAFGNVEATTSTDDAWSLLARGGLKLAF